MERKSTRNLKVSPIVMGLTLATLATPAVAKPLANMERCAIYFDTVNNFTRSRAQGRTPKAIFVAELTEGTKAPKKLGAVVVRNSQNEVVVRNKKLKPFVTKNGRSMFAWITPKETPAGYATLNQGNLTVTVRKGLKKRRCTVIPNGGGAGLQGANALVGFDKGLCPHCEVMQYVCTCFPGAANSSTCSKLAPSNVKCPDTH